jgi:cytochrome c biogenesis protein
MIREILAFFRSSWVVGGLLSLAVGGLIVSVAKPELLPPTLFFSGAWYTRLLWLLLAFSLAASAIRGMRIFIEGSRRRGVGGALYRSLTSIRLAITLIALFVLLGLISTIVPQLAFNREVDLLARYGPENYSLMRSLGLFTIFSTWYAYALVALFALNMGACTVKRLRASLRYARTPMRPKRPEAFVRMPQRRELAFQPSAMEGVRAHIEAVLRKRRFGVRSESGQLLAEKWRWERFSIDVFHIALLIAIGALILTNTLGYDYLVIRYKGDVFSVPGRDFQIRVDDFWSENYPGTERVMDWKTRLTVLDGGREVETAVIEVNHPFTVQGVSFYQAAMGEDWLGGARVSLRVERADGTDLGEYKAVVGDEFLIPEEGVRVRFGAFLPDFALVGGRAYSKTQRLLNPAAYLEVYDEESGELIFRTWTFTQLPEMQFVVENPYRFFLEGMTAPQFTGLEISWDPGLPVAYTAFALMIVMLVAHLFLSHQMIWVQIDSGSGLVRVGGRSRKGDFTERFDGIIEEMADHPARVAASPATEDLITVGGRDRGG